jgi:tetratricopeptide (TPR) repeat protein
MFSGIACKAFCFPFAIVFLIAGLAATEIALPQNSQPAQVGAATLCAQAERLYELGDFKTSEQKFLAGIAESEKSTQATEMRGACLLRLSNLQVKRKAYVDAEANARRAVAIFERFPLQRTLGLTTALNALGNVLENEEKYSEAIDVVERAWDLELGRSSDQAAQYRGVPFRKTLGRLYLRVKKYDRAAMILQENVSLLEKPGITGHTEVVPALNDLSTVYVAEGRLSDAEALLHRALSLLDRWPEEVTAEVLLDTLDQYAQVLKLSGNASKAKVFADRAAAIRAHYETNP